ncbi:MAG: antiterminator LoaP [Spirochaetes bacterium]|nr:antiterminator LoaP [Spirochaetota bacterium]
MPLFVVQVKTGGEELFLKRARQAADNSGISFLWPRRTLRVRRRGRWRHVVASLYPGYIFIEAEKINTELYWTLRRVTGFSHFLKDNHNIQPLSLKDQKVLKHFISFGEIIEKSKVSFDENDRIRIISGPLKGLEGLIVKINRRKGRIKIKMNLYENTFLVDLGFEVVETLKK